MAIQPHAIQRSIIELRVRDVAAGQRLSADVSAIVWDRLSPLLDRHLTALSDPDRLDRIERVEIDLGSLNPERLADDIAAKLEARLPAALREARPVSTRLSTPGAAAGPQARALLLISQFARTGSLPWWSDVRQLRALEEAVDTARRAAPAALAELLRGLAADARAIERLVLHLPEAVLRPIVALLSSLAAELPPQLVPLLAATPALAGIPPTRLSVLLWREASIAAARDGTDVRTALLARLAALGGATMETLQSDLTAAEAALRNMVDIAQIPGTQPTAREASPAKPDPAATPANPPPQLPSPAQPSAERLLPETTESARELHARADRLGERITALAPLLRQLQPLLDRLPAARHAEVAAALGALEAHAAAMTATPPPWADVAALLRPFVAAALTTVADVRASLALLPPQREPEQPPITAQSVGADTDARYVENAGLCLLWPFLARCFVRLSLLIENETSFVLESARHRAVGLLHYIASGERNAPEAWLALNKALCGLDPDDIVRFGDPVTDAEAEEADAMLEAAIAHAAVLGTVTIDGFRGSFLLRRGALSIRDGAWLLRVEKHPADVLIERFPWRTEWIRLPWMQAPLRVEW